MKILIAGCCFIVTVVVLSIAFPFTAETKMQHITRVCSDNYIGSEAINDCVLREQLLTVDRQQAAVDRQAGN